MIDTVVIATDGSASAERAVRVTLDFADRFDATVHALYVVDSGELSGSPESVRRDLEQALTTTGGKALTFVREAAIGDDQSEPTDVVTAVREGNPATEIVEYAAEHDADLVATGTRGRHGEHSFVLGSVAEAVVRKSPIPVLTVRQLDADEVASGSEPA